jgi:hypothetical protein
VSWSIFIASASRTASWQDGAVFSSAKVPGPSTYNCVLLGSQVREYKFEHFPVKTLNCLLLIYNSIVPAR